MTVGSYGQQPLKIPSGSLQQPLAGPSKLSGLHARESASEGSGAKKKTMGVESAETRVTTANQPLEQTQTGAIGTRQPPQRSTRRNVLLPQQKPLSATQVGEKGHAGGGHLQGGTVKGDRASQAPATGIGAPVELGKTDNAAPGHTVDLALGRVPDPPFGQRELDRLDAEFGRPFREFRESPAKTENVWGALMEGMTRGLRPGGDFIEIFTSRSIAAGWGSYPKDASTPDWPQMSGKDVFGQMHRDYLIAQGLEDEVRKIVNKSGQELQEYHLTGKGGPEVVQNYERFREMLGLMMVYQERAGSAMEHLQKSKRWQEMRW